MTEPEECETKEIQRLRHLVDQLRQENLELADQISHDSLESLQEGEQPLWGSTRIEVEPTGLLRLAGEIVEA